MKPAPTVASSAHADADFAWRARLSCACLLVAWRALAEPVVALPAMV